jgi:glycosyltransferase involved in cell wall biosynthesis
MTQFSETPKVALFFITFNQRDIALQTLRDALAQDYPASQLEIIVLDDGSTDGSYAALIESSDAIGRVKIVAATHEAHYRSAELWNRCIAAAATDSEVLIQVDDVRLRRDFVRGHVEWHRHGINHIVTGAKFEGRDETWELQACRRRSLAGPGGRAGYDVPPTAIWGASLSYPRRLLNAACSQPFERPFDETMTGYGYHEVEFAFRLQRVGARTVYDPAVGVFHRDHDPLLERQQRGLDREMLMERSLAENARYICAKHGLNTLPRW